METNQVSARVELSEHTNRILGVIKAKYGLKDKSEAINKFAEMYGEEFVEKEANEKYIKEMINGVKEHLKKYGHKSMSIEELDALCEI